MINTVRVVAGQSEADQIETDTKEIWYAPGTSSVAPPAGWTYEGGAKNVYAPGTTAGGTATRTEGTREYAPGTSAGGNATNNTSTNVIEGSAGTAGSNSSGQTVVGD